MYNQNIKKVNSEHSINNTISKSINIDIDLNFYLIIDSWNFKIIDLILNKIVDLSLERLTEYKDKYEAFSNALDHINGFLKGLEEKWEDLKTTNILIWLLDKKKLHFSKTWYIGVYLSKFEDIQELSWKNEDDHNEFSYIQSWEVSDGDLIIFSSTRLYDYITASDIIESSNLKNAKLINENLENILSGEKIDKIIEIISIKIESQIEKKENDKIEIFKDTILKAWDNQIVKKIIALFLILKDKFHASDKAVKTIIFLSGIWISIISLYLIISGLLSSTSVLKQETLSKERLLEAREYVRLASENMVNNNLFNDNIEKAENILDEVKEKKLYLNDVDKLFTDISIIKKQFNWVVSFDANSENMIYKNDEIRTSFKIIYKNKKAYVINRASITWPIIQWQETKKYIFEDLDGDFFIDATNSWDDIILMTNNSKVVKFSKKWEFKFVDVLAQTKWQKSDVIESYNKNLYLLNESANQIYKHQKSTNSYTNWNSYLKIDDSASIWKILSIAIDWWIYILKDNLELLKLFTSPKYRLESIVLNNLPENYELGNGEKVEIKARNDLNYVYYLMDNKVWVFKPNSKYYYDVKSLEYIWQIEWKKTKIKDFYVNHDWELIVLNETWLYKLSFEISDNNLIVR